MLQFHFVDVINYAFEAMTISRKKIIFLENSDFKQQNLPTILSFLNNTRLGFSTFKFHNAKTQKKENQMPINLNLQHDRNNLCSQKILDPQKNSAKN